MCGISPCDDFTTVRGRESIYEWLPTSRAGFPLGPPRRRQRRRVVLPGQHDPQVRPALRSRQLLRPLDRSACGPGASTRRGRSTPSRPSRSEKQFPYVTFVPVPAPRLGNLGSVWDPFAPGLEAKFDAAYAEAVAPKANDPLLIGYFISNEPLLEDVPKVVPTLRASRVPVEGAADRAAEEEVRDRRGLQCGVELHVCLVRRGGRTTVDGDARGRPPTTWPRSSGSSWRPAMRWSTRRFGKHDPNHLLIGDRWMPGTANSEVLVTTAAKYLDVVSINYYTYGIDKGFLDRIHGWAKKPLLFSEFYYAVADQGLQGGSKVNSQTRTRPGVSQLRRAVGGDGLRRGHPVVPCPRPGLHGPLLRGLQRRSGQHGPGQRGRPPLQGLPRRSHEDELHDLRRDSAARGRRLRSTTRGLPPGGPAPPSTWRFRGWSTRSRSTVPVPAGRRSRPCGSAPTAWSRAATPRVLKPPSASPGTTRTSTCSSRSPIPRR